MVNEYVYCPRLFYFEFVEGVFANNADKVAGKACSFGNLARKRVFSAYEQRLSEGVTHPVFGYRICYRRAIELQARLLAKSLTGDIEQYIPFLTR
jgi:CRISPR-associated protein Cas1